MKLRVRLLIAFIFTLAALSMSALFASADATVQETFEVSSETELREAATVANAYIELKSDITVTEPVVISADNVTLKPNGHAIEADGGYGSLFSLSGAGLTFNIAGEGEFRISRVLYDTSAAEGSTVNIAASGNGITVSSYDTGYSSYFFKIGNNSKTQKSTSNITGKLTVLRSSSEAAFVIYDGATLTLENASVYDVAYGSGASGDNQTFYMYGASNLAVNNSTVINEHGSVFFFNAKYKSSVPNVQVTSSTLKALSRSSENKGAIVLSLTGRANLSFTACKLEYSNRLIKNTSAADRITLTLTNTDTEFCGTADENTALLIGKMRATVSGGFHKLGASVFAKDTEEKDDEGNGVSVTGGACFSKEPCENCSFSLEENAIKVSWYKDSETVFAVSYYTQGSIAEFDISRLPELETGNGLYKLKFTSWRGDTTLTENRAYEFYPDYDSTVPVSCIDGIKYNLTTYASYVMNVYIPEGVNTVGMYGDSALTVAVNGEAVEIDGKRYMKYSVPFGAGNIDVIRIYLRYTAEYGDTQTALTQEIRVSLLGYAEKILTGADYGDTEKRLVADMLRYSNEVVKLDCGRYDIRASMLLDEKREYLTDLNGIVLSDETDASEISEYVDSAALLYGSYEPKFVFYYTEKFEAPSAAPCDNGLWLEVSYTSLDGSTVNASVTLDSKSGMFIVSGIGMYDMDATLTLKICRSNEAEPVAVGTYSLAAYIVAVEKMGIDTDFATVLYAYSLSAEAYKKSVG